MVRARRRISFRFIDHTLFIVVLFIITQVRDRAGKIWYNRTGAHRKTVTGIKKAGTVFPSTEVTMTDSPIQYRLIKKEKHTGARLGEIITPWIM